MAGTNYFVNAVTFTGGDDGFDGNDVDRNQGGPPCRKLKKRKARKLGADFVLFSHAVDTVVFSIVEMLQQEITFCCCFSECVNKYGDKLCDSYAEIPSYCDYASEFMRINCAKSCGVGCEGKSCKIE